MSVIDCIADPISKDLNLSVLYDDITQQRKHLCFEQYIEIKINLLTTLTSNSGLIVWNSLLTFAMFSKFVDFGVI